MTDNFKIALVYVLYIVGVTLMVSTVPLAIFGSATAVPIVLLLGVCMAAGAHFLLAYWGNL